MENASRKTGAGNCLQRVRASGGFCRQRFLSDAKREREETKLKNDQLEIALETIKAKSCDNCGKKCRVKPKGEVLMRYNCHLWQPRPEVQDESHGGDVNHERSTV